ncbi:DUF2062 domain-containing protein [Pseudoroseicyclus tamaricis]|uniref:DUF2062 domain-containing protein n=1 Tax=Pseudoroseicyclus tamaricis TaxID=2705421 RepID=A0A6B2JUV6_9RHOB|nr:DUF2062 domain-containing protein [Pseudoroseicyclus tamaricis]NDV02118.1 DUF2062 domain-containing protein [Pseudoroseicyclus tamaricis]
MVFKRRDRRPWYRALTETLWPRGGWRRAFEYVALRLRRLPDTPEKISRGIFAGVLASWTPFFGVHFLIAAGLALAMRGNVIAALLGTFFGNPLTYLPIAIISLQSGHFLLGSRLRPQVHESLFGKFTGAGRDLLHNIGTLFTPEQADWSRLALFWHDVFLPYLIGGIIPGLIASAVVYMLCLPVIRAYQNRRKKILKERLGQLGKAKGVR